MRNWKKVLDFIATTENIDNIDNTVVNIFLVLNPKHSSYWKGN